MTSSVEVRTIACVLIAVLGGCQKPDKMLVPTRETEMRSDLVAAVQHIDAVTILRHFRDGWRVDKKLPVTARALRFSPDGSTVAWVQDEVTGGSPTPTGYFQGPKDDHAKSLGPLGIRKKAAMGLAVDGTGRVIFLDDQGRLMDQDHNLIGNGSELALDDHGELAYLSPTGCLIAPAFGLNGSLCGNALRPLQYIAGKLLARDNKGLVVVTSAGVQHIDMTDVVDARVRKRGDMVAISRQSDKTHTFETVQLLRPGSPTVEILRAPVIIGAELDEDGSVMAIRVPARPNPYNALLAHAPDEFGGQALAGEAVRISIHLKESPVQGLEMEPVRVLFRTH